MKQEIIITYWCDYFEKVKYEMLLKEYYKTVNKGNYSYHYFIAEATEDIIDQGIMKGQEFIMQMSAKTIGERIKRVLSLDKDKKLQIVFEKTNQMRTKLHTMKRT